MNQETLEAFEKYNESLRELREALIEYRFKLNNINTNVKYCAEMLRDITKELVDTIDDDAVTPKVVYPKGDVKLN